MGAHSAMSSMSAPARPLKYPDFAQCYKVRRGSPPWNLRATFCTLLSYPFCTPAMTVNASYDLLSSLLPTTSFALAYTLPLLFVSILLTFTGAFLTLDRTRVFPPDVPSRRIPQSDKHAFLSSVSWALFLRGGLGGLCLGYAFGGA